MANIAFLRSTVLMRSTGFAALVAALASIGLSTPVQAQGQEVDAPIAASSAHEAEPEAGLVLAQAEGRRGWGGNRGGSSGGGGNWSRGGGQNTSAAPTPAPAPSWNGGNAGAQPAQAPAASTWNNGGRSTSEGRGRWSNGGGNWRGNSGNVAGSPAAVPAPRWSSPNANVTAPADQQTAPTVSQPRQDWQGGSRVRGNRDSTIWTGRGTRSDDQSQATTQGWNGGTAASQAPQSGAVQSQGSRRNWSNRNDNAGSGAPATRNRSYSDPERNRSYRDVTRNRHADSRSNWHSDRGQNDSRWNGNRNNHNNWQGYSDNRRWNGNNWNNNHNAHRWNRDWRHDNRYNWHSYRNTNRDHYRMGRYYAPYRDYSYRRLSVGFYLDSMFYGSSYWINDPWSYRLPEVDGPYRWIRYYDDALLVDIYSGEVVDVIHDFFW